MAEFNSMCKHVQISLLLNIKKERKAFPSCYHFLKLLPELYPLIYFLKQLQKGLALLSHCSITRMPQNTTSFSFKGLKQFLERSEMIFPSSWQALS